MFGISSIILYLLLFVAVYVQIFFLITFIERRKETYRRQGKLNLKKYFSTTIIVACWNEEKTISGTIKSLLNLSYPKDKLKIFIVDDGSTDHTWKIMKKFEKYFQVKIFQKENGGKHTALNLALDYVDTELVGCLDADSFVDQYALERITSYFEDQETMAVSPSIIIHKPKGLIQITQEIEYYMAVFIKKMLGLIGGIYVTPGPFSIYRKKVFDTLGKFRPAYNTEDMEIAFRMQSNHYKINQCHDAYVYTVAPHSVRGLYKQRLRWIYGFLNNTIDYRKILFNPKYGNLSVFSIPAGVFSIIAFLYVFAMLVYNFLNFMINKLIQVNTVGVNLNFENLNYDLFFINTQSTALLIILTYFLIITSIVIGTRMYKGRFSVSVRIIYFIITYSLIAPFWLLRAVYNTIVKKQPSWR